MKESNLEMLTDNEPYKVRIFLEDTDAGGFVYHANYLKYIERARTMLFYKNGIDHGKLILHEQLMVVVRSCSLDYMAPACLGDELIINTSIEEITGARLKLKQSIVRGLQVLVKADIVLACVHLKTNKPARIPTFITAALNIG